MSIGDEKPARVLAIARRGGVPVMLWSTAGARDLQEAPLAELAPPIPADDLVFLCEGLEVMSGLEILELVEIIEDTF